jgi:hypothetical protein
LTKPTLQGIEESEVTDKLIEEWNIFAENRWFDNSHMYEKFLNER